MSHPVMLPQINIGQTIRDYRLQKGMSQGDIEKRTGLLRCYLSRVENGHTIPSLDTLSKIAGAMEIALSQFFSESGHSNGSKGLPQLSDDDPKLGAGLARFLRHCLEKDPRERFQSAKDLSFDLEALGLPSSTAAPSGAKWKFGCLCCHG